MSSEALRLADRIAPETDWYEFDQITWCRAAAKELRTQAARIAELEAEVERLRKPLTPEAVWQLWAQECKVERPTVDLVEAFAHAIEAAKEGK